jgi:hypothetical protein
MANVCRSECGLRLDGNPAAFNTRLNTLLTRL